MARKIIKIELSNPRFVRSEIRDHASEFIHYARYAGYTLDGFNKHLSAAKLFPLKPEIAERNHRIVLETSLSNAKILFQLTQIYPSFKNWTIKVLTPSVDIAPPAPKKTEIVKKEAKSTAKTKKATKAKKTKVATKKTKDKAKPAKKIIKKKTVKTKANKATTKMKTGKAKSVKKVTKKKVAKKKSVTKKATKKKGKK